MHRLSTWREVTPSERVSEGEWVRDPMRIRGRREGGREIWRMPMTNGSKCNWSQTDNDFRSIWPPVTGSYVDHFALEPTYLPASLADAGRMKKKWPPSHCILMILIIRVMIVIAVTSYPLRLPTSCGTPLLRHCACPSINHWISTLFYLRRSRSISRFSPSPSSSSPSAIHDFLCFWQFITLYQAR